ncbi:MFS transporter [Metabacillus sp. GX 13764]|uniref:MFS transporter n=1 Tax=Metabacillus kandeliae TaxID=2900151 RepID=UPI001E4C1165|nr:MFS transporter [Metabacillus kandeliae]
MYALLKEEKRYQKLFLAGIVNGIGDRFSQVAMLGLILTMTGSGFAAGLALAVRLIPFLLFGPLGGYLADRLSKKKILVTADLSRVIFAVSFAFVHTKEDLWIIYTSSFMLALGECFYAPARKSLISLCVKKENLVRVNSLEQVSLGFVLIIGAFFGGAVSYLLGAEMSFWLNGLSFFLAAGILAFFPNDVFSSVPGEAAEKKGNWRAAGKILFFSGGAGAVFLGEALLPIFNGIDNVLISVYAVEEFKLGDLGVGLFYGCLGIGLCISFAVSGKVKKHFVPVGFTSLIAEGLLLILLSFTASPAAAAILYVSLAFFSGVSNACFDTVIMRSVPTEWQGKIFGVLLALSNSLIGISMLAAGGLIEAFGSRTMGFAGGMGFAALGFLLLLSHVLISNFAVKRKTKSLDKSL